MGVRDYRPEDGFRRIHWPATARVGQLQTRVYQPISGLDLIVCLNIATFDPHWLGVKPDLIEALVSKAASVIYHTFNLGYRVGLISNGGIAYAGRPKIQVSQVGQLRQRHQPVVCNLRTLQNNAFQSSHLFQGP